MLFKTLEKKTKQYLKAELHYREIINHITLYCNGKHVTKLKELPKRIGVSSKNTTKKLIKLAQQGPNAFAMYYLESKSSSFHYPLKLKYLIGIRFKNFRNTYQERFAKDHICFLTFIDECDQKYIVDDIDYNPSSSYIHNALLDLGYYSHLSFHKTKRAARHRAKRYKEIPEKQKQAMKAMMGKLILKEVKDVVKQIQKTPVSHQLLFLSGQRFEQDGWEFKIGKDVKVNLTIAVESASGTIVSGYLTPTETNTGHLLTISQAIIKYGKPLAWVFDRRTGIYGDGMAQIRDILESIDIDVITTSNPNGKSKVERTNLTLENDFIYTWMMQNDIFTINDFNSNMELFIDAYNEKYKKKLNEVNLFIPAVSSELNELKIKYMVKVLEDQTTHFQGKRYGFLDSRGNRIYVNPGRKEIIINHEGKITISIGNYTLNCSEKYKGKKVKLPTLNSIQQLIKGFKEKGTNISASELKDIHAILDGKISQLASI